SCQSMEYHLDCASHTLGADHSTYFDGQMSGSNLRTRMKNFYGKDVGEFVDSLKEDDLAKLARKSLRGIHVASPVFDGAGEAEIFTWLKKAALPATGQARLRDGRSGEPFAQPVTVGIMYMLKLHHLVD